MTTLTAIIFNLAESDAEVVFFGRDTNLALKHKDIFKLVQGNAELFSASGVRPRDRVLIRMHNDLESIVSFLALILIGAIPMSVKPGNIADTLYREYIDRIVDNFDVSYIYGEEPLTSYPTRILAWRSTAMGTDASVEWIPSPKQIAFVQFSSGSTSEPKPIAISHGAVCDNLRTIVAVDRRTSSTIGFTFLPLAHDMGLVGGLLSNLLARNSLLITSIDYFLRSPISCLAEAHKHGASVSAMPNFALRYITKHLQMFRSKNKGVPIFENFSTIYCGAEPIRQPTVSQFLEEAIPLGLKPSALYFSYGLAEATLIVSGYRFSSLDEAFDQSRTTEPVARLGPAVGNMKIKLETTLYGKDSPHGSVLISGPSLLSGYGFQDQSNSEEWFDTGDVGYLLDGELYLCGRAKDTIIVNGENLYVADIENIVIRHFPVRDCIVLPDSDAFHILVVPEHCGDFRTEDISRTVLHALGVAPRTTLITLARDVLRTTSGKPMRSEILKRLKQECRVAC